MKAQPRSELAQWRIKAHERFDLLWKFKHMSRSKAYAWLAKELNLPKKDCHIVKFDIKMCKRVIYEVSNYIIKL